MTDFLTDEEKAEQIKAWLKENGMSVAVGVTLAVGGLFGFKYWQEYQKTQSEEASAIYSEIQQDSTTNSDTIYTKVSQLKSDYSSTPYASLGAMIAAKQHAMHGDNEKAIAELQWTIDTASEKVTKDLAKLRLARLYIATKQFDKASTILAEKLPAAYLSLIEELKGDIHLANNEIKKARESYDKALLSSQGTATEYLKMKRDDLGKGT